MCKYFAIYYVLLQKLWKFHYIKRKHIYKNYKKPKYNHFCKRDLLNYKLNAVSLIYMMHIYFFKSSNLILNGNKKYLN